VANQDILAGFPEAASWSLALGAIGKDLVYAGIVSFAVSAAATIFQKRDLKLSQIGLWLGSFCLMGAMGVLITLFATNQFQYAYIFSRADIHTSMQYKVAGVWSGQQGSFMLWGVCSAIFGLLALRSTGEYRRWYTLVFSIFLGTICGILAYETPFNIMADVMKDGKVFVPPTGGGLTPSLQNYWIVIHPPTIFSGFGSLTVMFAYAMSAMLTGNVKDWIPKVRPWALTGMAILGLGVCMGGFWAYETLGWGGFWKWDPVENTSFVPWIVLAAFIHGIIVQTTRKRWFSANLWLAALPFILFTYGTFLTRSGYLTDVSVHSFAEMDHKALYVLVGLLIATVVGFLGAFLLRGRALAKAASAGAPAVAGMNRESSYTYGVLLLSMLALVISIGMSWPVIETMVGRKAAVVEEHLYHDVVIWFFVPIMILMAAVPFISWGTMPFKAFLNRFINVFSVSAGLTGFMMLALNSRWGVPALKDPHIDFPLIGHVPVMPWMAALLFLCTFVGVSAVWRIIELVKRSPVSIGAFVSHFGLATLMAGLILSRGLESHEKSFLRPEEQIDLMGYKIAYNGPTDQSLRMRDNKMLLDVTSPSGEKFVARPGLYYFQGNDGSDSAMIWPHIQRYVSHDMYITLHEPAIYAWKDPVWFKPGETKTVEGVTVKYEQLKIDGQLGQPGTSFGAVTKVTVPRHDPDTSQVIGSQTHEVTPAIVVGQGPTLADVDSNFKIVMTQMDAGDQSVALQLLFASPIFPIELFYKPLTILVWLGTGILFVGGLLSAWARRVRKKAAPVAVEEI
jgi:cytochrome c-type biogenesis protein CcmF